MQIHGLVLFYIVSQGYHTHNIISHNGQRHPTPHDVVWGGVDHSLRHCLVITYRGLGHRDRLWFVNGGVYFREHFEALMALAFARILRGEGAG